MKSSHHLVGNGKSLSLGDCGNQVKGSQFMAVGVI